MIPEGNPTFQTTNQYFLVISPLSQLVCCIKISISEASRARCATSPQACDGVFTTTCGTPKISGLFYNLFYPFKYNMGYPTIIIYHPTIERMCHAYWNKMVPTLHNTTFTYMKGSKV
jgi:hypothetical protein